ncbi:TonB-dependent receptor plug domain-containing protein [Candidatus Poribacteria bacterium]|nr:TonB-dependent receptor plug domain-containing protein [Candidatus Poribacteria bacterium]
MVVTGTRTERVISDSPVLTQTVSERQLREEPYLHIGEALEDATGLYVQDDPIGGTGYLKTLSIQGMDKRRVLVLVNGNPVFGSYAGRMNLANFGVGGVERVEVVKGPSSSLYGSGAIGGKD